MAAEIGLWAAALSVTLSVLLIMQLARADGGNRRTGTDMRSMMLRQSARTRVVNPFARRLANPIIRRVTPDGITRQLQSKLAVAGPDTWWTLERLVLMKLLGGLVLGGLGLLRLLGDPSRTNVGMLVVLFLGGFFLPDRLLRSKGEKRQQTIDYELPDILDQMVVSVEAGLGFEAAMARTARSNDGPLANELARVLQDVRFGMSRREAFQRLVERSSSRDLRQFVNALTQAEQLGMPLGEVLRVQAGEMRTKRRLRAEEAAMKIPVKLVFPLLLCILPALFTVIMGPAVLRFMESGL